MENSKLDKGYNKFHNSQYPPLNQVLEKRQTKTNNMHHNHQRQSSNARLNSLEQKQHKNEKSQSKQKPQLSNQPFSMNSVEITRRLILSQNLSISQIQNLITQLASIKTLKYNKLSQRIRDYLVQTVFQTNITKFLKILEAQNQKICSIFLLQSIFYGFEMKWMKEIVTSKEFVDRLFSLYLTKIPDRLNKHFVIFAKQLLNKQKNLEFYGYFRQKALKYIEKTMEQNSARIKKQNTQKIIPLVLTLDLEQDIKTEKLVKLVPLQKVNEYTQKKNLNPNQIKMSEEKNGNGNQKVNQKTTLIEQISTQKTSNQAKMIQQTPKNPLQSPSKQKITVPPLIHHSILQLLKQNDVKQIQKLLKTHKIPHTHYPQFVYKLQMRHLEYLVRTHPVYFIDQLIHNKINLIQNLIDLYIQRRKNDLAEHFINKYRLRGEIDVDQRRILRSPLIDSDFFGPTESHVLKQTQKDHYICLKDYNIQKQDVLWIDSLTIYEKPYTTHLKQLLSAKQIGLDTESSVGVHVFELAKLQIIQIYDPQANKVFLFDVKDFKNDKKKRHKKIKPNQQETKKQHNSQKLSNNPPTKEKLTKNQTKSSSMKVSNNPKIQQQKYPQNPTNKMQQQTFTQKQKQQKKTPPYDPQQKTWYRFTKIIQNVYRRATIYGHSLHTDMDDIFIDLGLKIKQQNLTIKDSQKQFKKYFPQQTKSSLSYLSEKCLNKEISKYQQCSAWDKRPLRRAQKHYAALDAVLPYKLVKWMEENCKEKKKEN